MPERADTSEVIGLIMSRLCSTRPFLDCAFAALCLCVEVFSLIGLTALAKTSTQRRRDSPRHAEGAQGNWTFLDHGFRGSHGLGTKRRRDCAILSVFLIREVSEIRGYSAGSASQEAAEEAERNKELWHRRKGACLLSPLSLLPPVQFLHKGEHCVEIRVNS